MVQPDQLPTEASRPARSSGRSNTILERVAQGIREQNWFAVGLELVIVVVGVAIGFQVSAWSEERADREREQNYLRQLALDLAETELRADTIGAMMAPLTRAARRLAQAHFLPEPPPRDSVLKWVSEAPIYHDVSPVLGTAEALVATGDIGLIRDDSLRSAITAYLEVARENIRGAEENRALHIQSANDFVRHVPMAVILAEAEGPEALAVRDREDDWMALAPPGVPLPALDTDALVRDPEVHSMMAMMSIAKGYSG
ncbi:MAG: hypothetical protein P8188_20500, partial [Gemmatimonadota bacterium]